MEHCESCGTTDSQSLYDGDQGYTACCNEPLCHGTQIHAYREDSGHTVTACCMGKAVPQFIDALGDDFKSFTLVGR